MLLAWGWDDSFLFLAWVSYVPSFYLPGILMIGGVMNSLEPLA